MLKTAGSSIGSAVLIEIAHQKFDGIDK